MQPTLSNADTARAEILAELNKRIVVHRNGHFHRSADGYSDPDSVVDVVMPPPWVPLVLHAAQGELAWLISRPLAYAQFGVCSS
jgi:hypothetical protein